jgi:hypothetical protein
VAARFVLRTNQDRTGLSWPAPHQYGFARKTVGDDVLSRIDIFISMPFS